VSDARRPRAITNEVTKFIVRWTTPVGIELTMGTFNLVINIDRPPVDVFAVVGDPTSMPRWYDAVEQVTPTTANGPEVGARYLITRSLPGGEAHNDVEVTEYLSGRQVTLESRSGPTPFRYSYTLESTAGGTALALDGSISSAGLRGPAAHLDAAATQLFKQGMKHNLRALKRLVESPGAISQLG
jgi:uncharacterized protein YndB with AHSA1/START domain